jgi:hypothetical protein
MESKYIKLSQNKLRTKNHCYGHFYTLKVNKNNLVPCRSGLEIVEAGSTLDNETELIYSTPDAIIIMMNPGGSEPDVINTSSYVEQIIYSNFFSIVFINKTLVRAIPDTTQNRIMNIMNVTGWKHVRILNLSMLEKKAKSIFKII